MSSLPRVAPLMALALVTATAAPAQQFEGVFIVTKLQLSSEQASEQDQDEAQVRAKLFGLTAEQLLRLGAEVDSQRTQVKGPRFRTASADMGVMGVGYTLMDATSGVMRMVVPARRGYYEVSLRGAASSDDAEEHEEPRVESLGRTQMIGGLRCAGYRVTDGEDVSQIWTTTDAAFRDVFQTQLRMLGEGSGITTAQSLLARYGYPVMTQALGEDGTYRVEMWSLQRQPMADSLFVVPAGFTKITGPGMR